MRREVGSLSALVLMLSLTASCGTGADGSTGAAPAVVTVTVTAPSASTTSSTPAEPSSSSTTGTTIPTPSTPSDPLASVKIDPNSAYSPDQQRYLAALRQALNEELVSDFEIPLVVAGTAACSALDQSPDDLSQLETILAVTDEYLDGSSIPAEYVAIGAAAAMCPDHKEFVLRELGGLVG